MIHKLRKKLTLAYTITVGMILACVLAVILIMTEHYISERNADSFEKITMEILSKLQYSSSISQLWLTEQEIENQLIIHIEENAVPFLFPGSYPAQTDRDSLIKKVKELAREQQVNTDAAPISTSLQRTDVMAITGSNKDSYLACAMVLQIGRAHV